MNILTSTCICTDCVRGTMFHSISRAFSLPDTETDLKCNTEKDKQGRIHHRTAGKFSYVQYLKHNSNTVRTV